MKTPSTRPREDDRRDHVTLKLILEREDQVILNVSRKCNNVGYQRPGEHGPPPFCG